jgi:hypothetical protein
MRIIGLAVLCREPEAVIRGVSGFRLVAATKAVRPRAPTTRRVRRKGPVEFQALRPVD